MSEWKLIETAPTITEADRLIVDVWAVKYELIDTKTGEVRKVGRRFPDAIRWVHKPESTYSNALLWSTKWDCPGLTKDWTITHYMPSPKAPHNPEKEE